MISDPKLCPQVIQESLKRYVENGVSTGSFLIAVLANDLMEAFNRADDYNLPALGSIVAYITMEIPIPCCVSYEKVDEHLQKKAKELCS